jgi:DNA-binding NarL/FixJ family response regulator
MTRLYNNPWNLTPSEERMIRAVIDDGCSKSVARALGVSDKTVTSTVKVIRNKMKVTSRVTAAVVFDRWARSQQVAA